jgi:flagellar basal-body rod protein FlgB
MPQLSEGAGAATVSELSRYNATIVLEKALPVLEASHRVLANNIANANAPDFTPSHVSFRESLQQALAGTAPGLPLRVTSERHIPSTGARPVLVLERDSYEPGRNDKSRFNVDREMVELQKNTGRFIVLSSILTKRYQQLREVLRIP